MVDEYYKEGYDENSVFTLQSTSKSVTSALIGIAIDKGYIESVDVPLSTYFPQILESGSEYKNQLTIWHLLTHSTGLDASELPMVGKNFWRTKLSCLLCTRTFWTIYFCCSRFRISGCLYKSL